MKHSRCQCGARFIPYGGQKNCSYDCYMAALFPRKGITREQIEECHGMTIKDAAYALNVSYVQLRRRLNQHPELRAMFPNTGKGRWMAQRGYAYN